MKHGSLIIIGLMLIGASAAAFGQSTPSPGQQLALEMRQTQLLNYHKIAGQLKTRGRRGRRNSQALTLQTAVQDGRWQSIFQVSNELGRNTRLTISRSPTERPRYFVTSTPENGRASKTSTELSPSEAMQSFGNSDFWYADLGLEFFYWPEQTILTNAKIKMRKGISCFVLESRRPDDDGTGYNRVRSWISREHGGLIYAEAYTPEGKHLKTFEVSDVQKIQGEWKLKELKIRNELTRSTTRLEFNHY